MTSLDALPDTRRRVYRTLAALVLLGTAIRLTERWVLPPPSPAELASPLNRIPVPEAATVYPREVAGLGALFFATVFLSLYFYRQRRFIIEWTRGWIYLSLAMLVQSVMVQDAPTRWSVAVSGMFGIASAFTMIKSAATLGDQPWNRRHYGWATVLSFTWYTLARLVLSPATSFGVSFVAMAILLGIAAFRYLHLARTRRWVGAGAICLALAIVAASNVVVAASVPLLVSAGALTRNVLLVDMACYAVVALGMLALVFEEVAADMRRLAVTDPLTGCFNRLHWDTVVRAELKRRDRFGVPLSVLFVDVNHFKQLNDTAGHAAGDQLLVHVADTLRRNIRAFDVLCRWGGDEFVILMACDESAAVEKSRRLRRLFAESLGPAGWPDTVGLSIGVAGVPPGVTDIEPCVREADERMYADKLERGRH